MHSDVSVSEAVSTLITLIDDEEPACVGRAIAWLMARAKQLSFKCLRGVIMSIPDFLNHKR